MPQMQELSELIYKRNEDDLFTFLSKNEIEVFEIHEIHGNDRAIIFLSGDRLYFSISGSDDKQDWKENMFFKYLKPLKKYNYAKAGAAIPANEILQKIKKFCDTYSVDYKTVIMRGIAHSRGADILESLTDQLETDRGKENIKTYGNGNTGAGGPRFARRAKTNNFISFLIKGDFAKWINPFNKCSGKVIYLPQQRKGLKWILGLFKGKMNHREYRCLRKMLPYCEWD